MSKKELQDHVIFLKRLANSILSQLPRTCFAVLVWGQYRESIRNCSCFWWKQLTLEILVFPTYILYLPLHRNSIWIGINILGSGLPPPYFPKSVTKNQLIFFPILDPFLSTIEKNYFFPLKPPKYEKSAQK